MRTLWCVYSASGYPLIDTLSMTRVEAIARYMAWSPPPATWRKEKQRGLRCVKVKIVPA